MDYSQFLSRQDVLDHLQNRIAAGDKGAALELEAYQRQYNVTIPRKPPEALQAKRAKLEEQKGALEILINAAAQRGTAGVPEAMRLKRQLAALNKELSAA